MKRKQNLILSNVFLDIDTLSHIFKYNNQEMFYILISHDWECRFLTVNALPIVEGCSNNVSMFNQM